MFDAYAEAREVRTEHIAAALRGTFPLSRTMDEQITALRQWARVRARLASSDEPEPLAAQSQLVPKLRQETRNPFVPG